MPMPEHYTVAFPITPSDTVSFTKPCHGIYVGGAGNITLVDLNGNVVLFTAVAVGFILQVAAKRVNVTGTSATALVGVACN